MKPDPLRDEPRFPRAAAIPIEWRENVVPRIDGEIRRRSPRESGAARWRFELSPLLRQALVIVLLGICLGFTANQISPHGLPLVSGPKQDRASDEFITLVQATELWRGGVALFLDAREPADFAAGHIGNALNLPAQSFPQSFPDMARILTPEAPLVLYCDGLECDLSRRLAESLRGQGLTNLRILANGWTAWREADLPRTQGGPK